MKLGIKKIEYISVNNVHSWAHVGRNDAIAVNNFKDGSFSELKFTDLTASLEEEWLDSPAGIYSNAGVTGVIRANKEQMRDILASLIVKKNIFRVTDMNGQKYLIGSSSFCPRTFFKMVISDITTSEYQFTITCKSTHGIVFDTSS